MTTTKQYDFLNRLTGISSQPSGTGVSPESFNYSYNSANQRTKATLADSSYWSYAYDPLGQVTNGSKHWLDNTAVAGEQFGYGFDTIGNRIQTLSGGDTNGGSLRVAYYTNNALNQIISRTVPGTNDIIGVALATNAVTVNGVTTSRKVEFFQGTVGTNNVLSPAWLTTTVAMAHV